MDIKLNDVQKWYAEKLNKEIIELDSYDLFCAKVAYDYACEQLLIPRVRNCGGAIPFGSLSDSFKKSIDSIEDNLNK